MIPKQVSQDDILDVEQMTRNIEISIGRILSDNDMDLAFSALVSGTINSISSQCQSMEEYIYYRDVFIKILQSTPHTLTEKRSS